MGKGMTMAKENQELKRVRSRGDIPVPTAIDVH